MEKKQGKQKQRSTNMILRFLPKGAFQNPPFSPGRDKRFSGPLVSISIIPDEARRKTSNSKDEAFESPEPTSPKVSCMGQIKHKKNVGKSKKDAAALEFRDLDKPVICPKDEKKKRSAGSAIRRIFSTGSKPARKSEASGGVKDSVYDKTPSLGQMRRFASGRDSLGSFDWKAQVAPAEGDRNCYSDEDGGYSDGEEEEVIIPFSAPIVMGGGEGGGGGAVPLRPRKEINLWKRRTMNPPRPLQLNS